MSGLKNSSLAFFAGLVLLIGLASCGGGGGGSDGSSTANPTQDGFVNRVVSDFGAQGGFEAVAIALDKGYSLAQIVGAAMSGSLGASGDIPGASPAYEATDGLTTWALALSVMKLDTVASADINQLRTWLQTASEEVTGGSIDVIPLILITEAAREGYSMEQIIEAFLFGYSLKRKCYEYSNGDSWCSNAHLYDEQGNPVTPARDQDTSTFSNDSTSGGSGSADSGGDAGGGDDSGSGDNSGADIETWILGDWNTIGSGNSGSSSSGVLTFYSNGTYSHSYDWAADDGSSGHANLTYSWWLSGSSLVLERGVGTCSGAVTLNTNRIDLGGCPSGWGWTLTR